MGVWRPLRSLSILLHSIGFEHSCSGLQRYIQSSTPFIHQVNKETLLQAFGSNTLLCQGSSFLENYQAELGTHRLNFMATTLTEVPVLEKEENAVEFVEKKVHVVFVLGGPGSGKGTQCAKIVEKFGFTHLSAGDLLRAEINSGSENGTMIQNMITEGKIVPSEVTVKLLQRAMRESENDKFLIDGFPRNEENRAAFERVTGIVPEFVLFFDCPEDEMERRLLSRNQGRVDDNIETIRKRFRVFIESSLPVIDYYSSKGKVRKIDATGAIENIFEGITVLFEPFIQVKEKENGVND